MAAWFWLLLFLLFCAVVGLLLPSSNASKKPQSFSARVVHVVDGDSLYLQGFRAQVRLWGVDAPEYNQEGGYAATELLIALALGNSVTCRIMDTDKYGRMVARCFLRNGKEINRLMIESGKAREYRRFTKGFYGR